MAEIKTGIFAKNVQKRLNRAQEKVLQKLGKADETKDEQFEQCVQNFKRQESEGSRLQREMKAYLAAVKGMQQASMNLTESLHEVYEPDWYGKDDVMTVGKSCDALWEDFHQKLVDSSLITLDTYLSQFPDIKTRVSKRSRKLIDYDSARHHLETLQASTIRNDRKVSKAEEELKKAQKVFDDFNVDLQQELPTLWDSRVGFYVSTFKNVTHLEAKFHREISVLCHKLYEVMNKLAEQHSDKMFTIQGAPSDSGPLRFARTPTPPDESPPESPEDSPNHTLAPGPHRPKSPSLLKKGPPVPPPPKITPTTELHQEQIISLFDNNFAPDAAPAPAPAAQAVDSLLDMDFDPFKPDSAAPIGQSQSPMSQTLPWDLWTAPAAEAVQPGASDWAADFSGLGAGQEAAAAAADAGENGAAGAAEAPDWPPAEGWGTEAAAAPLAETAEAETVEAEIAETAESKMADAETAEIETAAEDASVEVEAAKAEVSRWDPEQSLDPHPGADPSGAGGGEAEPQPEGEEPSAGGGGGGEEEEEGGDQAMPGIIFTDEHGQEMQDVTEGSELGLYAAQGAADGSKLDWGLSGQAGSDWSGSEYETADEWAESVGRNGGWASAEEEPESPESAGLTTGGATEQPSLDGSAEGQGQGGFGDWGAGDQAEPFQTQADAVQNKANLLQSQAEPFQTQEDLFETQVDPFQTQEDLFQTQVDPFQNQEDLFKTQADPFQTQVDPFQTQEDLFQTQVDPFQTQEDLFQTQVDPFQTQEDLFKTQTDPFQTQEDLFQKQAGEEDLGPANETRFQASEPAVPSTVPGPAEQSSADPSEADPQADPFSQAGGAELVLDFVSDPFAEPPGGAGGGWASDPFASEGGQMWPENWAPAAGGETWAFPSGSDGQPNGFAQWGAFPDPPASGEGGAAGSDSPWQEVSASGGFFPSSGPGEFTANWGDGDPDPSAALSPGPGRGEKEAGGPAKGRPVAQLDAQGSWINATEAAPGHRDTESSDLSEDEITNRRLGRLYQDVDTEKEEVSNNALNGVTQPEAGAAAVSADSNQGALEATSEPEAAAPEAETEAAPEPVSETGEAQEPPAAAEASETSPTAEKPADTTEAEVAEPVVSPEAESPEITPPTDAEKQPCDEAALETATTEEVEVGSPTAEAPAPAEDKESPKEQTLTVEPEGGEESKQEGAEETEAKEEKMPIPSVVIEPASSNEGDDDRDGDITSPTVSTGNGVTPESQPGPPGMPPGFLYKVEALHDFEAANSDELELKKGDVVLVLPTENVEDQDAGWLTGIKESDWLQQGGTAPKGLFPENFVQRSE
ncbi:uncharacterized protein LOC135260748 isoform X4 [Anguilla rostrata]|uniref:uncharacterized protein LOC135260748 isoform X4 n=1 Tax=Anguilla rostrata TaxID=7938 RepID=UPI0030CDF565